jgi:hypothetical protein
MLNRELRGSYCLDASSCRGDKQCVQLPEQRERAGRRLDVGICAGAQRLFSLLAASSGRIEQIGTWGSILRTSRHICKPDQSANQYSST